MSYHILSS
uniref:Uncharacterized protein n=1 Tax=Arundo donax TaxID=35708 RepID=A0A0A8ZXP4_ARUDO